MLIFDPTNAQISGVPLLTWGGILSQSPFWSGRYQVALSATAVRRKKLPLYVLQQKFKLTPCFWLELLT